SMGEKYDQMERARKGELDVIIGPRSALFTPFPDLGVIVIDEEHENSYKSESMPKYHARETAMQIAKIKGASVVLGSATPSLEAYYRAGKGEHKLYQLSERLTGGSLPKVYTIDLREELKEGNRSIFSRKLKSLLENRLMTGEQSMLFLNRRGYAGFVSCRACGHVMKCPHCDVSLSEHRNGKLVCHYCGYEESRPKTCPACGSKYLLGFKAGTEQIEEAVHKEFPTARVLRMDADSTRSKESYEKILSAFADGAADILVGTQMIVKGHDFPNVTLVGILAADLSLNQNDYRAGERTFQLLTQAAGRAGRGSKAGEVVIQTYQPEHYSIIHAAKQDYEGFYAEEIVYRELLQYPPAAHMLAVLSIAKEEKAGGEVLQQFVRFLREKIEEQAMPYVIGPAPAALSRLNDLYRHILYFKHAEYEKLVLIKDILEAYAKEQDFKNISIQFDFDPMTIY
ncbi:MAG: primosomal protein N', partial [Lachnospiraceae bacterium]|nr:primosomal protein N' [Lachnospiraceae bacterium]